MKKYFYVFSKIMHVLFNLKASCSKRSRVGLGDMVDIGPMAHQGGHNAEVSRACSTSDIVIIIKKYQKNYQNKIENKKIIFC